MKWYHRGSHIEINHKLASLEALLHFVHFFIEFHSLFDALNFLSETWNCGRKWQGMLSEFGAGGCGMYCSQIGLRRIAERSQMKSSVYSAEEGFFCKFIGGAIGPSVFTHFQCFIEF